MTTVSFTGTTSVTREDAQGVIDLALRNLRGVTRFVSGAAVGIDTFAAEAALARFPDARHTLVVPAAPCNWVLAAEWLGRGGTEVFHAPQGSSDADSYMLRNDELVAQADLLLAFPETQVEQLRSGTWATIRRARKAGVPVQIFPLGLA